MRYHRTKITHNKKIYLLTSKTKHFKTGTELLNAAKPHNKIDLKEKLLKREKRIQEIL